MIVRTSAELDATIHRCVGQSGPRVPACAHDTKVVCPRPSRRDDSGHAKAVVCAGGGSGGTSGAGGGSGGAGGAKGGEWAATVNGSLSSTLMDILDACWTGGRAGASLAVVAGWGAQPVPRAPGSVGKGKVTCPSYYPYHRCYTWGERDGASARPTASRPAAGACQRAPRKRRRASGVPRGRGAQLPQGGAHAMAGDRASAFSSFRGQA